METNFAKHFLKESSYRHMPKTDQALGMKQPPLEMPHEGEHIDIPTIEHITLPEITLETAIIHRQSIRQYPNLPLSLMELAYALYMTQGVKKTKEGVATLRTVPSAGARHAFETYLLINHVEGLKPGLYRYLALSHKLVCIKESETIAKDISEAALKQKMIEEASVPFIWVADAYRMTYRYGHRGYRYLFLDAGHVCQNLYLVAQQLNCGTCAIAAFDDEMMNEILKVDGEHRFVIYMGTFGKRS
jgi:SagB-type dehydrogenase family enzyme